MENEQDVCRFIGIKGQCQIAKAVNPKPSRSSEIGAVTKAGLVCSAKNDPVRQATCDCFVPRQQISRTKWLEDFQEG